MELVDEFIVAGVSIVNPQDLCNGIDNLAREVKGRVCIDLDIDRQRGGVGHLDAPRPNLIPACEVAVGIIAILLASNIRNPN